ncbi:DUF1772 domain-containing protein [Candidatus Poseidoniales archaeon]|nr:DUF1772 domain-containing protein [Candidatus Poseidoniales archaeon]
MILDPLNVSLFISISLSSLVAGLLFGFAVVVMPGLAKLADKNFLFAFKHIDGIIQDNQPLFIVVWAGSILSAITTLALGVMNLSGDQLYLVSGASGLYLLGVQLPTFRFNIPLNNMLQNLEINALDESEASSARADFETPWNRWNRFRTIFSVSMLLLVLLS